MMRFGILGYGGIAQRFVGDSAQVREAEITVIASRTEAKQKAAASAVKTAQIVDLSEQPECGLRLHRFTAFDA